MATLSSAQRCSTVMSSRLSKAGLEFESDFNDSEDCKSEDEMRRVIDDSDSESPSPKKKEVDLLGQKINKTSKLILTEIRRKDGEVTPAASESGEDSDG